MDLISKFLALYTVHRFLFAYCKRKPHWQSKRGQQTLRYCTFSAPARRGTVRWICSSCSCYGSFLGYQKGSYTSMGMRDGHISVRLVGGKE